MNKVSKKQLIFAIIIFIVSIFGLYLFIEHICKFQPHTYFFRHGKPRNPYTTTNVVSRWADFAFFTYISLIIFCIWGILNFIGIVFKIPRLTKFTNNPYIVLFICLNQFIVLLLYTGYELIIGGRFSWYGNTPSSWYSFITNMIVHYFVTSIGIIYFFNHDFDKIKYKNCLFFLVPITIYALIVKITGMYCYSFEWYPYPLFTRKSLWYNLFGSLKNYKEGLAGILLITALILIITIYLVSIYLATIYINHKCKKKEEANQIA